MKNTSNRRIFSFVFLFLLLAMFSISVTSLEVEDEKHFDYFEWSEKGPAHWGDLHKEWAACKEGQMQSPIDLSQHRVEVVPRFSKLKRNYNPSHAILKNRGHDIALEWVGNAGSIRINGTDYALQQCHWHSPSEHTLDGKRYPLELHMVHQSLDPRDNNKIAVIGLLYNIGSPDPFLYEMLEKILYISDTKKQIDAGVVDPRYVEMGGEKFYRYMGSLTTPPCTEGVIWTVNKRVRTVSIMQVMLLRNAVDDGFESNARPLQPINGREIHFYVPKRVKIENEDQISAF